MYGGCECMQNSLSLMTYEDFERLLEGPRGKYYIGRWEYFKEVINIIEHENVHSVIELGPGLLPIVKDSDLVMNPEEDSFGNTPYSLLPKNLILGYM